MNPLVDWEPVEVTEKGCGRSETSCFLCDSGCDVLNSLRLHQFVGRIGKIRKKCIACVKFRGDEGMDESESCLPV